MSRRALRLCPKCRGKVAPDGSAAITSASGAILFATLMFCVIGTGTSFILSTIARALWSILEKMP